MRRGDTGLIRQNGVILMRLGEWVLSQEVVHTNGILEGYEFAELAGLIDNVPLESDDQEPIRVTLFKGEECLLDGMYFMDAAIWPGDTMKLSANLVSSKPRNGDAQPR